MLIEFLFQQRSSWAASCNPWRQGLYLTFLQVCKALIIQSRLIVGASEGLGYFRGMCRDAIFLVNTLSKLDNRS